MSNHFADRLTAAIRDKGAPACVGLDPIYSRLPAEITGQKELNDPADSEAAVDAILEFTRRVVRVVAPLVPAVKINSAFFERYYWDGIEGYYELVGEAAAHGLVVIGDVKRADIGHSSSMYAKAHVADPTFSNVEDMVAPDAITVNPYFGQDGLRPFIDAAAAEDKGLFVLVQTSNEGAGEIQGLTLEGGMKLREKVGVLVNSWAAQDGLLGECGYSLIGAVVAPGDFDAAAKLRALMPFCYFLVPGFGAQGGNAETVAPCFKADGSGALITASRSVLYAFSDDRYRVQHGDDWEAAIEHACRDFVADVGEAVSARMATT